MEANKFETANFYGKRLVKITDSNKYGDSVDVLKAMTGQDHLRIERKHQQQTGGFIYGGLVILASNENLATTDHTSGLERRRLTVTFDRRVPDSEKQSWDALGGEDAVLYSEIPGLINWLLELSQEDISRIIRNPPERTKAANLEAMKSSNPLAEWFLECCVADLLAWTQVGVKVEIRGQYVETKYSDSDKHLYPSYLQWAQQHNRTPVSIRRFREITIDAIKTLGFDAMETRRGAGQGIQGVRLKTPTELISVGIFTERF
jgi:putative DNA primase/helicase